MRLSNPARILEQKGSEKESVNVCGNFHADVENEESKSFALQRS